MTRTSVAELKAHLAEVLRSVEGTGEPVIIERRGKPVAVLQPFDASVEAQEKTHWSEAIRGVAADIPDFEPIMREVVKSRSRAKTRRVRL